MAYSSYPFDNQSTSEAQYRALFKQIQQSGVITPAATNVALAVTPAGGMNVSMAAGDAMVEGFYFTSDSAVTLTVQAASSVARTDQVILRLDLDANAITPVIVRGNTSTGAATALVNTATIFELLIATITVPASATSIVAGNITDARPYASNPVGVWTTATRPANPRVGQTGLNLTLGAVEVFYSGSWKAITPADTDWQDIPLATALAQNTTKPQYRVKAGVVYFRGDIKRTDGANIAAGTVLSINPASPITAIAPGSQTDTESVITTGSNGVFARGFVTTSGVVTAVITTAVANFSLAGIRGYLAGS